MKVLIVDQDELSIQLIKSKLASFGHHASDVAKREDGIKRLEAGPFDVVLVDPSPATNAHPFIVNARRAASSYQYILLMGHSGTAADAIKAGANDILIKPLDSEALEQKMQNAERMVSLVRHMGDTREDFPSAGGVIAKSAFNQLFLTSIDRANRYAEQSSILLITITNYQEIYDLDGKQAASYTSAQLAKHLVRVRRQSDIAGQTRIHEYALLLQRPSNESEPAEAAARFAQALEEAKDIALSESTDVQLSVKLIDLPTGALLADYKVKPGHLTPGQH